MPISTRLAPVMLAMAYAFCEGSLPATQAKWRSTAYSGKTLITLALISVLPEYAVDLHFAWVAGKDPSQKAYAIANMTGANRVLIGIGWSLVAVVYYFKHGRKEIPLDDSQGLELSLLLLATVYSFILPLKGTLSLIDCVVFFAMFLYYAGRAARG